MRRTSHDERTIELQPTIPDSILRSVSAIVGRTAMLRLIHLPPFHNLRAVQLLPSRKKVESVVRYLDIEVDDALATAEQVDV